MSARSLLPSRRWLSIATLLAAVSALVACGGGGSSNPAAAAAASGKTSFAAGPITGFGSVIINGVRFDDSAARVSDDDGLAHDKGELKLGMVAEVEGGAITSDDKGQHGEASDILFRSEIIGPVGAIDPVAKTLIVLGQTVDVSATTAFDDRLSGGLGSIKTGDVVEIYGMLDTASRHYSATRIEPKPNAPFFKIRGIVANLDSTGRTLQIGGQAVSFAGLGAGQVPATLANGLLVRVKLQPAQVNGTWVATQLRDLTARVKDHDEAEVKGRITSWTSAMKFSIDGVAVDASAATFPQGTVGVVLGARVEVEGRVSSGVIVASKVSVETEDEAKQGRFELHGAVMAIDTTAKTLSLRGLTVDYGAAGVQFKDGSASDLAIGVRIEVKGALSSDGIRVEAVTIAFEH